MSAKRVRRATRRGVHALESAFADALLSQALQSGAIAFLSLRDVTRVLNVCRTLRYDAELPLVGLASTASGAHLLRHCSHDWSATRPSFLTVPELLDDTTCDVHAVPESSEDDGDVQRFLQAFETSLDPRRGQATALLSALAMVEKRIVPLCYRADEVNTYGDICTARPVVLPLPLGLHAREPGYVFTTSDIRDALNRSVEGIGEVFVATPQEYTHVSDFGAHWEATHVTRNATAQATSTATTISTSTTTTRSRAAASVSKVSCAFCDAAQQAIKEYRKDARALLRRFNDVLKERKDEWKAEGCDADEIHQRRSELKAEFFPEDSYPDINFAEGQDDAILADICESSKFPMNPFDGQWAGFDRFDDDVFNALREEYVELCMTLVQPLKRVLVEECGALVGRRVFRSWMGDEEGSVKGELVAGVTRSGILVGVYVITRRVE